MTPEVALGRVTRRCDEVVAALEQAPVRACGHLLDDLAGTLAVVCGEHVGDGLSCSECAFGEHVLSHVEEVACGICEAVTDTGPWPTQRHEVRVAILDEGDELSVYARRIGDVFVALFLCPGCAASALEGLEQHLGLSS